MPDGGGRIHEGRLGDRVDGRIRSGRVIEVLSRLVSERGAPKHLRSDNGPEFVSRALLKWIADQGIDTALIEPGKPWQNGVNESFNGKFRDECLSLEWFRSRGGRLPSRESSSESTVKPASNTTTEPAVPLTNKRATGHGRALSRGGRQARGAWGCERNGRTQS